MPRVGGSLYRLNRDIRFSRDKRPYKTHCAALLWEGGEKHSCPGVYLHVSPEEVIFGGGLYMFEEGQLDRYRRLVADDDSGERLTEGLAAARNRPKQSFKLAPGCNPQSRDDQGRGKKEQGRSDPPCMHDYESRSR